MSLIFFSRAAIDDATKLAPSTWLDFSIAYTWQFLPFIYWKSFPENAGERSGCKDVAGIVMILLTDAASRTAVHRTHTRAPLPPHTHTHTHTYVHILDPRRGGWRTNITCRKNSDIPWWEYKNMLPQRAAATVPRVHISLQRDGDIPLQARGDLDKEKFSQYEVPLSVIDFPSLIAGINSRSQFRPLTSRKFF